MKYRAEIDGLRALAVVPVVFFHAGLETFGGGFVGVDVFFVISGYLITTIIINEREEGRFSLLNFYERRARRIIPALVFITLVSIGFAWLWLMPREMKDFSQSLVAVAAFSSNMLFWLESGYFDTAAELKPLLHTWSLAVEEQYYILFPLLVLLVWRFNKNALPVVLGIGFVASLGLAHWAAYAQPGTAFYLLPTRGWEILLGAFCALYLSKRTIEPTAASRVLSIIGILLIMASVFLFDATTPTPSLYTLVPTIGVVLIILFCGREGIAAAVLRNRYVVGTGLISYSLYLWHQPLIVFAKQRFFFVENELDATATVAVFALVLILSYCTWRWVEAPFRSKNRVGSKGVLALSFSGAAVLVSIGITGHVTGGYPSRFPGLENVLMPAVGDAPECKPQNDKDCVVGDKSVPATIALIGDSHSVVLQKAMVEALRKKNLSAVLVNNYWCAPLLDVGTLKWQRNQNCRNRTDAALREIAERDDIKDVVMVAEWANFTTGQRWAASGTAYYFDAVSKTRSVQENVDVFNRGLARTLTLLREAGKRVVLVGSVPEYRFNVPAVLGKTLLYHGREHWGEFHLSRKDYERRNKAVSEAFKPVKAGQNIAFVNTYDVFCSADSCKPYEGLHSLYTDGNHLSFKGAQRLVSEIFKSIGARPAQD